MPESKSHKEHKNKAAGKGGVTEKAISGGHRIDAVTSKKATEIERSGNSNALKEAAKRLKDSGKSQKILQVPQNDMNKAVEAAENVGVKLTVRNLSGTKRRYVKP
jgi:hypothetical protein